MRDPVSCIQLQECCSYVSDVYEDLFRQELQYSSLTGGLGGSSQQSGNIGQLLWQVKGRTTQAYGLSYDYLDWLTGASSSEYDASNTIVNSHYFNESQSFDVRGNMTSQLRSGLVKGASSYSYKASLDTPNLGLVSGTNQTTTATGVSSIPAVNIPLSVPHNFLNLPTSFSFNGGNSIELLYDGLGTKLRKTVRTNTVVSLVQDYLGGIELKNSVVEAVYNEEGRAYNTGGTYRYEYVLRDHLGNTRLVFTDKDGSGSIDNSEILSESHYYPFGRKMDGAWYSDASAGKYRYLYNGKELSDEFDLNFYDYGARWYDPGLGSWWQIDPLAEVSRRFSPYVFSNNNPLRFIDPDGMQAADVSICPTCPKGGEYDAYRDNKALFTYDNSTGIVLNGDGTGATVYGQRTSSDYNGLVYGSGQLLNYLGNNNISTRSKLDAANSTPGTSMASQYLRQTGWGQKRTPNWLRKTLPIRIGLPFKGMNAPLRAPTLGGVAGRAVPLLGKGLIGVSVGISIYNVATAENQAEALTVETGGWAGAWAASTAAGSALTATGIDLTGPWGWAAHGVITIGAGIGGFYGGKEAGQFIYDEVKD